MPKKKLSIEEEQRNCVIWLLLEYRAQCGLLNTEHFLLLASMANDYNIERVEKAFGLDKGN